MELTLGLGGESDKQAFSDHCIVSATKEKYRVSQSVN